MERSAGSAMRIPWRLKSRAFRLVDLTQGEKLLYLLQKHVTRRAGQRIGGVHPAWKMHARAIERLERKPVLFEFGAGKSLAQNLFLGPMVERQILIDRDPMLDPALVERARADLQRLGLPLTAEGPIRSVTDLKRYGIDYHAPCDAAATGLPAGSIDICVSTYTFEHIPEAAIPPIFAEIRRILVPGGLVSARIDYSDHYAHTDPAIGKLNYLRFDADAWARYNHRCHYQNRLRHHEYRECFRGAGFEILEDRPVMKAGPIAPEIAARFTDAPKSWAANLGWFLLRKA